MLLDRQTSLQNLLKALILTWRALLNSLLSAPPSIVSNPILSEEQLTQPQQLVQHIRLITINMHHLVNELRPVQVSRASLFCTEKELVLIVLL